MTFERSPLLMLLSYDILNSVEVLFLRKELESLRLLPCSLFSRTPLKATFFCIDSRI